MTRIPHGGSAAAIAAMPKRACLKCGKTLERKTRASGKLETVAQFAARQTCGRECQGIAIAKSLAKQPHPARRERKPIPSPTPAAAPTAPSTQVRKRDLLARIDGLEQRLATATRAFDTTRAALETAIDERDELQRRLDAARALPIPDPAELRQAKRELAKERARADQAEAARDQALTDLRRARDDLATTSTPDTNTAAAERDVALAELDRIKNARQVRPELLTALHRATTKHPELPDFITGTAPTDAWFPAENAPGTERQKGKRA